MNKLDRYEGCLLGLATGDALGVPLEFSAPGTLPPVTDMVGGGPFQLPAGAWTDDTSMALCLAESLLEKKRFDAVDQLSRYVRWWKEGHMSSTGVCFDIGNATRQALERYLSVGDPYCGATSADSAGNGSLIRLAPVPLYFANHPAKAIVSCGNSSRTTHGAPAAVDACRYFGALLVGVLQGLSKEALLETQYAPIPGYWRQHPLAPEIEAVANGSFKTKNPPALRASGFVAHTLEAALWAFYHTDNFADGALMAVNLGEDADSTGAVYGQLAGAYYGASAIPQHWLETLLQAQLIRGFAQRLNQLSG